MAEINKLITLDNLATYKTNYDDWVNTNIKVQYAEVPTASSDIVGKIIQYKGVTNNNYTNGYFYKCVATTQQVNGVETTSYSWQNINVQDAGSPGQGYATETWVQQQGYATETWVGQQGYATESWVQQQGYLTQHQDISGKQDLITSNNKLSSDLVDDTNNTNKFVTASEKNAWNNKSDFSGSYNDLTDKPSLFSGDYNDLSNKPTIPVVPTNVSDFTNDAGYVTKDDIIFYISISSSNTTTIKWDEVYEAHQRNAVIIAKIDYVENSTTIPVAVPLYSLIGSQSGGSIVFTFVIGTITLTYIVTGTGSNVCTVVKQQQDFELKSNKTQDIITNNASTTLYPSANAVYKDFQRKPVIVWQETTPANYLSAINADLSASPAWQLTNLDLTPYKRIKIYSCAGRKSSGIGVDASTTPAIILEMSLDTRNAIADYGGNYVSSVVVQKPNDANRLATLTCAVSSDKTSFVVLRQTSLYGTGATSNNDVNANVFMIEGYYD